MKQLSSLKKKTKKEIHSNKLIYLLLSAILLVGFFLRVYRVDQVLGFYFDQGRDANVIWDFLRNGKFFLIGPTTGIAGIFRGPFYYYLVAPFYLLDGGNPIWPSIFLAFTSVMAILLMFYLGLQIKDRTTGILAAIIASFSFYIILASRWLSNPTPMLILSMILVLAMFKIYDSKRRTDIWWIVLSFTAGSSLFHFGSAGEFFYFLAIIVFAIWQRKKINLRIIFLSLIAVLATAAPQIIFDIRHDYILSRNIRDFLFNRGSFDTSFTEVFKARMNFYYDVFTSKLFDARGKREIILMLVVLLAFLRKLPEYFKNGKIKIVLLLFFSPLVGLLFFQGNEGNIYDYYLTGYYLIFILLFALGMRELWGFKLGKLVVIYFLYVFYLGNVPLIWSRVSDGLDGPHSIALGNQMQALDWIYEDVGDVKFNTDVYVPPVIPHAYDYLFKYRGTKNGKLAETELVDRLYTLYEVDPPHPERLEEWMKRQAGIGEVEEEISFGGITVQRRKRIYEEE